MRSSGCSEASIVIRSARITTALYWVITFGMLLWLVYVSRTSNNPERLLLLSVVTLVSCIGMGMFAVIMHVTSMTRKVLQAIALLSSEIANPPEGRSQLRPYEDAARG